MAEEIKYDPEKDPALNGSVDRIRTLLLTVTPPLLVTGYSDFMKGIQKQRDELNDIIPIVIIIEDQSRDPTVEP